MAERDHQTPQHLLGAARLLGAGGLAALGQLAVDMPASYFGPASEVTLPGVVFGTVVSAATGVASIGLLRNRVWAGRLQALILASCIGVFLPAVISDPVVAGGVTLWHLSLLGRLLFPPSPAVAAVRPAAGDEASRWLERNGPAARHLLMVALLATIAVVGYRLGQRASAFGVCVALGLLATGVSAEFIVLQVRLRSWTALLPIILFVVAICMAWSPAIALVLAATGNGALLLLLLSRTPLFADLSDYFYGRPTLLVLLSFVLLIALGTMLLTFPAASSGRPVTPLDALFTATSAACVTGLVVLDTPRDFSTFGHLVILMLMQAGGLNIMVLSTFAALLLGRGLGLKGIHALGEMLDVRGAGASYRLITSIVGLTLAIELAGTAALTAAYLGKGYTPSDALWHGLFHSVSAFCNAGFALQPDSLVMFQHDAWVLLVIAALITTGGLGFAVLAFAWLRLSGRGRVGLAVQVKIVLSASLALTVLGWIGYATAEWHHTLAGLEPLARLINALFQSVTCRTAGFNSVSLTHVQPVTILLIMLLMFVGASPGGTGGGIKTTTLVVLLSAIPAIARGTRRIELWRRTINLDTVFRSAAIAVISSLVVVVGAGLLLASHQQPFEVLLFEVVSAFGTVGLSLGATTALDSLGKTVLVAVMLVGRIGPLSLALLLGQRGERHLRYPDASIMVG